MHAADSRSEILNSWKEVAHYLGRGVRTVQRWEHDLGLPVRRPRGKSRSAIIAFREELDGWLVDRPQTASLHDGNGIPVTLTPGQPLRVAEIIVESRGLRSKARELRKEMSAALHALVSNVERMQGNCGNDSRA
jgi:hypothetical protein